MKYTFSECKAAMPQHRALFEAIELNDAELVAQQARRLPGIASDLPQIIEGCLHESHRAHLESETFNSLLKASPLDAECVADWSHELTRACQGRLLFVLLEYRYKQLGQSLEDIQAQGKTGDTLLHDAVRGFIREAPPKNSQEFLNWLSLIDGLMLDFRFKPSLKNNVGTAVAALLGARRSFSLTTRFACQKPWEKLSVPGCIINKQAYLHLASQAPLAHLKAAILRTPWADLKHVLAYDAVHARLQPQPQDFYVERINGAIVYQEAITPSRTYEAIAAERSAAFDQAFDLDAIEDGNEDLVDDCGISKESYQQPQSLKALSFRAMCLNPKTNQTWIERMSDSGALALEEADPARSALVPNIYKY